MSPMSPPTPTSHELRDAARAVLAAHWREPGFTCPNAATYPWLWLWDSCFHSIVWAELGEPRRAVSELTQALAGQGPSGFVPHLRYLDRTRRFDDFWGPVAHGGAVSCSSITQPPVYALTVIDLLRRGIAVPEELLDAASAGLWFLFSRRRRSRGGLIELVHPWESGCDHSPRWDDLMAPELAAAPGDPYDERRWFDRKGELLTTVDRDAHGAPLANDAFAVGSVAFSSITAYGARLLGHHRGDGALVAAADDLALALSDRWDPDRRTFVDDGPTAGGSGRIRTAEGLLGVLVVHEPSIVAAVARELTDPEALGGRFGPAQVHRDEPSYRPGSYWRGPSWPQLDDLLVRGLAGSGVPEGVAAASTLASASRLGAWCSGWAEYWDPDDAAPGGAVPQSWATLAVLWDRWTDPLAA